MTRQSPEVPSGLPPLVSWTAEQLCMHIGVDTAILGTDGEGQIAVLIDVLTDANGHDARKPIRELLGRIAAGRPEALAEHLDHGNCFTRWEVVNILGELAAPGTLERVVRFALNEDEVHARWRSFWAVSRYDRDMTVPLLLEALHGEHPDHRWRAALMLSMLDRAEAGTVLMEGLDHPERWVQWEALSAIKALKIAEAEERVAAFLDEDRAIELRQEATLALGAIGSDGAKEKLFRALDDPSPQVRWRAAMGLAKYDDAEVRKRLRLKSTCDPDAGVRQFILEFSSRFCGDS